MSDDPILRTKAAMLMLGIGRTTLHEWVKKGLLPPAKKLGPRAVGWRKSDLDKFLESRRAAGGAQ